MSTTSSAPYVDGASPRERSPGGTSTTLGGRCRRKERFRGIEGRHLPPDRGLRRGAGSSWTPDRRPRRPRGPPRGILNAYQGPLERPPGRHTVPQGGGSGAGGTPEADVLHRGPLQGGRNPLGEVGQAPPGPQKLLPHRLRAPRGRWGTPVRTSRGLPGGCVPTAEPPGGVGHPPQRSASHR